MKKFYAGAALAAAFALGFVARGVLPGESVAHAQVSPRVFELRTYKACRQTARAARPLPQPHAGPVREARHREHRLFRAAGRAALRDTLIYLIAHASREAARKNFAAFGQDPEWQKVAQESQVNGKIVAKVESVFLDATDYSPLK